MDPFIEARGLWGDFHDKLIAEIERAANLALPPQYAARVRERTYIEWVDPQEGTPESSWFEADVKVRGTPTDAEQTTTAVASVADGSDTVVMHALAETEQRELFLEIIELDPQRRLVTCIEILSPANKVFGSAGWKEYERKRRLFLQGRANLAPQCQVSPGYMTRPLPPIAIPLLAQDKDVAIPLQPLVKAIYDRSRYVREMGYDRPIQPPLAAGESAVLRQ